MSVLYVSDYGSSVHKKGGRITVMNAGETIASIPSEKLDRIVMLGPSSLSGQLAREMLNEGKTVMYCSTGGKMYGYLTNGAGNTERLLRQVDFCRSNKSTGVVRQIVGAKITHQKQLLSRFARNHAIASLNVAVVELSKLKRHLQDFADVEQLRGIEGRAATVYFAELGKCILTPEIKFDGRNRRPPRDPVNSLLSLGYMCLLNEMILAVESEGLNGGIGCLHTTSNRRPALALDLMEPFRQPVVDKLVLRLINKREIDAQDFDSDEEGGLRLKKAALLNFFTGFAAKMNDCPHGTNTSSWREEVRNSCADFRRSVDDDTDYFAKTYEL